MGCEMLTRRAVLAAGGGLLLAGRVRAGSAARVLVLGGDLAEIAFALGAGDRVVATVHTAKPLTDAQRTRLSAALSRRYDGNVSLNEVFDPAVVGGLRVQIADDVIDGSISARLADLRQKLAG